MGSRIRIKLGGKPTKEKEGGEGRGQERTLPLQPLGSGLPGSAFRALVLPYSTQGHQKAKQPISVESVSGSYSEVR